MEGYLDIGREYPWNRRRSHWRTSVFRHNGHALERSGVAATNSERPNGKAFPLHAISSAEPAPWWRAGIEAETSGDPADEIVISLAARLIADGQVQFEYGGRRFAVVSDRHLLPKQHRDKLYVCRVDGGEAPLRAMSIGQLERHISRGAVILEGGVPATWLNRTFKSAAELILTADPANERAG